jgi:hypothetical protein
MGGQGRGQVVAASSLSQEVLDWVLESVLE